MKKRAEEIQIEQVGGRVVDNSAKILQLQKDIKAKFLHVFESAWNFEIGNINSGCFAVKSGVYFVICLDVCLCLGWQESHFGQFYWIVYFS